MSLFRGLERRSLTPENWGIPSNGSSFGTESGQIVTDDGALRLIAVQACVRLLADSIASLPLAAFKVVGDQRIKLDPQPSLIVKPFEHMTTFEGLWQMVQSLVLRGEVLNLITAWDSLERPTSIMPIHPGFWTVTYDKYINQINYVPTYRIAGALIAQSEFQHIKRFPISQRLHGLSPIEYAKVSIGLGLAADQYGARWFGDSANPSSTLTTDQDLTEDQIKKTQKAWIASHNGRRHPAVLTGGFKWSTISITPEESQFLATRQFQRSEIAMLFGVPPHMIGDVSGSTSWGTGIEQQSIGFVTYTLRPWLTCIEAALSDLLPRGQYVRFNVDALLRGDTKSRYEAYTQARNAGWLSVNNIRAKEEMPPVPHGDDFLQPLNYAPLGTDPTAIKTPAPPTTPIPPTGGNE